MKSGNASEALVKKALGAKRESKQVEFKTTFDPNNPGDWCELFKDIVALANSGGGIIVFGLNSSGHPEGDVSAIGIVDPADVVNKIAKYIGNSNLEFEVVELEKEKKKLLAFCINAASIPIVFQKPGTYDAGSGKQKTAFGVGTVYFRHGAKSEPGNTEDIRSAIDRQLEIVRKAWVSNVRRVVQAPTGAQVVVAVSSEITPRTRLATNVRVVDDRDALPVQLTRDPALAQGRYLHEQVSDRIFDEINNVVDANKALAKGQKQFFLGLPIYYRIYAERNYVNQPLEEVALLMYSGLIQFYAPCLFWMKSQPDEVIAIELKNIFLFPANPYINAFIRIAILLGESFCDFLYQRWHDKWKNHPQPPSFYWTFRDMYDSRGSGDDRLTAARLSINAPVTIPGFSTQSVKALMHDPQLANDCLSKICMKIYTGGDDLSLLRANARALDFIVHGEILMTRGPAITAAFEKMAGDSEAGDETSVPAET